MFVGDDGLRREETTPGMEGKQGLLNSLVSSRRHR